MSKFPMLRILIIFIFGVFGSGLPGCSALDNKPTAADTQAATEHTAFTLCDGCHGPDNVRVEFMSPNIIGQKKGYLAAKLHAFRDSKRMNPFMNGVAEGLTDQEIVNLAAYYSNYGQDKK
jgi:cytochrome c553